MLSAIGVAGLDTSIASAVVLATIAICTMTDRQSGFIFDVVVGCGAALVAIVETASGTLGPGLLGAVACGGPLLALHELTRRRGLGMGDAKLAALIGAGFTFPFGLIAVGAAFVLGAVSAIVGIVLRRISRDSAVPFGPYLALGSIVIAATRGIW